MGLGLVGLIGLGRVSLIGRISHVGQISLVRLISHIIGHNCLDGVIGLGLVSLVDLVGLSGINDLVGLNSLVAAIIAAAEFLVVMSMQAAAAKNTQSCHQAGKRYQNYQCSNLVLLHCIIGITLINL